MMCIKMDNFHTFLLEKGYIKLTPENEWIILNMMPNAEEIWEMSFR